MKNVKTCSHSRLIVLTLLALTFLGYSVPTAFAQGSAFTYQGRLTTGTNPVSGNYDLTFSLYNASSGGSLLAGPVTDLAVPVSNGLFTVQIDFGAGTFTGSSNWLSIGVRTNGTSTFSPLLPLQQVTPTPYAIFAEGANAAGLSGTIPSGDLSGTYTGAVTLNNPSDSFTGSGIGLSGVALLAGGNAFSGTQVMGGGELELSEGSGTGYHADQVIGPGGYLSGEQHSINFDDGVGHVGSLIVGYNGTDGYFSVGNLYNGSHQTTTTAFTVIGNNRVGVGTTAPQEGLSVNTGLNVDQVNLNDGDFNNGNTNGNGLTFGSGSGEGIASQRQPGIGGNSFGLDFYTDFARRMSITQSGLVGIGLGTNKPVSGLEVANGDIRTDGHQLLLEPGTGGSFENDGLVFGDGGLPGINGGYGPFLSGYYGGALGALAPNTIALAWDSGGDAWVSNNLSAGSLTVRGDFLVVNGGTPVYAYLGDDGSGNDVQIGSQKSGITALACFNTADGTYMHLYCSAITIEGGADLAEPFKITKEGEGEVPQGAVVVIDEKNPGHLKMSDQGYDTRVAGVVSGANGVNPGIQMQQQGILEGGKNVALTGRVYVQADASNGAIEPGDLLTTSGNPGRAMKVTDHARAAGAILGKAMTRLSEGQGMVLVLVTLQ